MIVVNAVVTSKPEDIAALQSAIHTMEAASREESGCSDYTFSVELNNPNIAANNRKMARASKRSRRTWRRRIWRSSRRAMGTAPSGLAGGYVL